MKKAVWFKNCMKSVALRGGRLIKYKKKTKKKILPQLCLLGETLSFGFILLLFYLLTSNKTWIIWTSDQSSGCLVCLSEGNPLDNLIVLRNEPQIRDAIRRGSFQFGFVFFFWKPIKRRFISSCWQLLT